MFMSLLSAFVGLQQKHPEVTVLDPPCAIQRIYNRQSMLQGIADINLADCDGNFYMTIFNPRLFYRVRNSTVFS